VRSKRQGKNTIGREGQCRGELLPEFHGNERSNHKTLVFRSLLAPVAAEFKGTFKYTEDGDLELAKVSLWETLWVRVRRGSPVIHHSLVLRQISQALQESVSTYEDGTISLSVLPTSLQI
jgi:hypothetical protein